VLRGEFSEKADRPQINCTGLELDVTAFSHAPALGDWPSDFSRSCALVSSVSVHCMRRNKCYSVLMTLQDRLMSASVCAERETQSKHRIIIM
jgi:hypothetical protein